MFSEVRKYLADTIKAIDPKLISIENVYSSMGNYEDTYSILFNTLTPNFINQSFDADLDATIIIYKKLRNEFRDEDSDEGFCNAVNIQSLSMDKKRIEQDGFIKTCTCTSIEQRPLDSNDLVNEYVLRFNIKLAYDYKAI